MIRQCPACGKKNRIPVEHLADEGRCGACKAPLPPIAEPIDADAKSFDEIVSSAHVPVLIDFWAEWCGPCRMAAPEVKRVAAAMSGRAIVLKVDTERGKKRAEAPEGGFSMSKSGDPSFAVLLQDHEELRKLFDIHQRSLLAEDIDNAVAILTKFQDSLLRHIGFEETFLLPKYAQEGGERSTVQRPLRSSRTP